MTRANIDLTVGDIINEYGCIKLLDAVFEQAIKDYISGMKYAKLHGQRENNHNYNSAVMFLNETDKGKRILNILDNLTDEQIETLLKKRKHYEKGEDYNN